MGEKSGPKLLDLMIPKGKEFMEEKKLNGSSSNFVSDEKKLELRLGLPGEEEWGCRESKRESQLLSLNYYCNTSLGGGGGGIVCGQEQKPHHTLYHHQQQQHHPWSTGVYQLQQQQQKQQQQQQKQQQQYLNNGKQQMSGVVVMGKDGSQQTGCTRIGVTAAELQNSEKKAPSANTAVPNTSQKRAAPTPVVGWPPIRSFRKNLASSSSAKATAEPQNVNPSKPTNEKKPATDNSNKGLFVKINMDGVPIGRKVDLNAYNCYDNLSAAVDTLFRGLLAAQRDSCAGGMENKQEEQKPITGLLDGTGEFTLVYEDNEGDRMLVGDVPWHMFVSTVKRLRVLKSSDLPTLSRSGKKQAKMIVEAAPK